MEDHIILGVHITNRIKHVSEVQAVFTEFGCSIKTRLGLHEASDKVCSPNGLIVLEMVSDPEKSRQLTEKLKKITGVEVQQMVFHHAKN